VRKLTTSEFIKKAKLVHPCNSDEFYKLTIYNLVSEKVMFVCPEHGIFFQRPNDHLSGKGCNKCAILFRAKLISSNTQEFIDKSNVIHNNRWVYSKTNYFTSGIKVTITCVVHGDFLQIPDHHLAGHGCPVCGGTLKSNTEDFIMKANIVHLFLYDYSKFIYKHHKTKGIIICKLHGEFLQQPNNHLSGQGCPSCLYKNEQIVAEFLTEAKINYIRHPKLMIGKKRLYPDFYIHDLNLYIEYHGRQHFVEVPFGNMTQEMAKENLIKQKLRDTLLRQHCEENNINLLEIDGRIYVGTKIKKYLNKLLLCKLVA